MTSLSLSRLKNPYSHSSGCLFSFYILLISEILLSAPFIPGIPKMNNFLRKAYGRRTNEIAQFITWKSIFSFGPIRCIFCHQIRVLKPSESTWWIRSSPKLETNMKNHEIISRRQRWPYRCMFYRIRSRESGLAKKL